MYNITEKGLREIERIEEADMKYCIEGRYRHSGTYAFSVLGFRTDTRKTSNTEIPIKLSPIHLTPRREFNTVHYVRSTEK